MIFAWVFWCTLALILYTYIGYPLGCILVGGSRRPPSPKEDDQETPPVSVLVPAHNEVSVIKAKIENFLSLDYPEDQLELIIADDGSDDGTSFAAEPFLNARIKLIQSQERIGKAATMNILVEAAEKPLLLFSDANVMLEKNALRELVWAAGMTDAGAVTGEVRLIDSGKEFRYGELAYYWMERRIQNAESRLGSVMGVDGGMYLIHRELYEQLPADTILDDFAVSMNVLRKGKRVVYHSAARATENGTPSGKQEFSRRVRIAAGAVQLVMRGRFPRISQVLLLGQFISHKLLRWLSPLMFFSLFVSSVTLFPEPLCVVTSVVLSTLLVALALTLVIPPLRETRLGSVLYYFGMSQLGIVVGLCKGMLKMQPPQWEKASRPDSGSFSKP